MRRALLALSLLLAACDDPEASGGGTSEETAEASSESGDTDADDESSTGDTIEEWRGTLVDLRIVELEQHEGGGSAPNCTDACGASECSGALREGGIPTTCDTRILEPRECWCTDEVEAPDANAGVSGCFAIANSPLATDPVKWEGGTTCDDFCGRFGGFCAATVWYDGDSCGEVVDGQIIPEAPTDTPEGFPRDAVFRAVCDLP